MAESRTSAGKTQEYGLWEVLAALSAKTWVDLTHAFDTGSPHYAADRPMTRETLGTYERDGYRSEYFCLVGQWGTHVDPPAHFHEGLPAADDIPVTDMLLPLAVINVHEKVAKNPDYALQRADIAEWERRHGEIPPRAFVALRSDWSKRWPDQSAIENRDPDGIAHTPGWSLDALKFLYETRGATAIGHETLDTDPGMAASRGDFSLESYALSRGHYQIGLMANLDRVPEAGAIVSVTWPKIKRGSGFPARVFAILP